ncbi:hypothetical protein H2200_000720 [Cladophialophora chaetospira]|uniref:Uncharacterized protein n=1 Tax=Cladophialophora chaetospira TaxID=386627 RepID=A0AA38XP26_9EURO|nr:hypothetical protein H2200_000720 [Cladophialophora chaetospira]
MVSNEFPPATPDELGDFLAEVVKARLIRLLTEPAPQSRALSDDRHHRRTQTPYSIHAERQEDAHQQTGRYQAPEDHRDPSGHPQAFRQPTENQHQAAGQDQPEHETEHLPRSNPEDSTARRSTAVSRCSCLYCQSLRTNDFKCSPTPEHFVWLDNNLKTSLAIALDAGSRNCEESIKRRSPQEILDWYAQLFSAVIGVSALGGGFTFTVIFSDLAQPRNDDGGYVRTCLAASWLLFVSSIAVTSFTALFVSTMRKWIIARAKEVEKKGKKWGMNRLLLMVTWMTLFVQLVPIGAFLASAEAVRQYHGFLGAVSMGLTAFVGAAIVFAWLWANV